MGSHSSQEWSPTSERYPKNHETPRLPTPYSPDPTPHSPLPTPLIPLLTFAPSAPLRLCVSYFQITSPRLCVESSNKAYFPLRAWMFFPAMRKRSPMALPMDFLAASSMCLSELMMPTMDLSQSDASSVTDWAWVAPKIV